MENKLKVFNYVVSIILLISLGFSVFLYLELINQKELNRKNSDVEEIECAREVCTYGRYKNEYTQEESESFNTKVYRHIEEIVDSQGTSIGYSDLTFRLNEKQKTFVLDILSDTGEGIFLEGTYTENGEKLSLSYDIQKYIDIELPESLEFTFTNDRGSLRYTGENIPNYSPSKGYTYHLYWME